VFKKIIIPLDGSPLAEAAIPYGEEIATRMGSNIIFLTVLPEDNPDDYANHNSYISGVLESSRQRVQRSSQAQGSKQIEVDAATRNGNPAEGILDYVRQGFQSLIVMATHGRSGLNRWAIGSVADKITRSSIRQPLILIRAKDNVPVVRTEGLFKKTLVPLDGSDRSEAVIDFIAPAAPRLQTSLTLFKVVAKNTADNGSESYLQEWCQRLRNDGIKADYEVRTGSPAEQIVDYANEKTYDLVAMSTRGQNGVSRWTPGSVAQKVLLAGSTPLLLVKA
jgi:nucleotide-binding universal stress UspA family protein